MKLSNETKKYLTKNLLDIVKIASTHALYLYSNEISVSKKSDGSYVTNIDLEIDGFINQNIRILMPDIQIISEERSQPNQSINSLYFLIDPIDGTNSLVKKEGEFTINIALMENHKPLIGIIAQPVKNLIYYHYDNYVIVNDTKTNQEEKIYLSNGDKLDAIDDNFIPQILLSKYHNNGELNYMQKIFNNYQISYCSSSEKIAIIAAKKADLYLRTKPTMEWDIAAGHAILKSIGGNLVNYDGQEITYGKKDFINREFIAFNNKNLLDKIIKSGLFKHGKL